MGRPQSGIEYPEFNFINLRVIEDMPGDPQFFASPAAFRTWLRRNHKKAKELIVGYHKKHTGRPSMTWEQSVAEALCYGWIDGIRRSLNDEAYTIRFTPRRPGSRWSAVNVRLVKKLEAEGRMTAVGRAVFEARKVSETDGYAYENMVADLEPAMIREFKRNRAAWAFFEKQPPSYRGRAGWWIASAKQPATRERRLAKLIEASSLGKRLY